MVVDGGLFENRPNFSPFLITSCGNEAGDHLRRYIMTENHILLSRINENVCKSKGELRCRSRD